MLGRPAMARIAASALRSETTPVQHPEVSWKKIDPCGVSNKKHSAPPMSLEPRVSFLWSSISLIRFGSVPLGKGSGFRGPQRSSSVRFRCPVWLSSVLGRKVFGIHMQECKLGKTLTVTESLRRYLSPP